jgi:hypothetical protein
VKAAAQARRPTTSVATAPTAAGGTSKFKGPLAARRDKRSSRRAERRRPA